MRPCVRRVWSAIGRAPPPLTAHWPRLDLSLPRHTKPPKKQEKKQNKRLTRHSGSAHFSHHPTQRPPLLLAIYHVLWKFSSNLTISKLILLKNK